MVTLGRGQLEPEGGQLARIGDDVHRLDDLAAHAEHQHAGQVPVAEPEQGRLPGQRLGDQRRRPQNRSRFLATWPAPRTTARTGPSGPRSRSPQASGASTASRPSRSPLAQAAMNFFGNRTVLGGLVGASVPLNEYYVEVPARHLPESAFVRPFAALFS